MTVNSRLPDFLRGDMWAAIAAVRIGERRLVEIAKKYGVGTFKAAMAHFMDYGEQVSRKALAELPRGRFELAEEQDDGASHNVTIDITGDEFIVDLRDNPDQVKARTIRAATASSISRADGASRRSPRPRRRRMAARSGRSRC